jgi:hypothetical protein
MPSVYSTDLVAAIIVRVVSVVIIKAERDSDDSEVLFVMTMAVVMMTATFPRSTVKLLASGPRAASVLLAAAIVACWPAHSSTRCHRRCCSAAPTAHNSCAPYGSSAFTASSAHDSGTPASNATAYSCSASASAPTATTSPAACGGSAPTATTSPAACGGSAPTATSAATLLSCGNINHDGRSSKRCDSD